MFFSSLSSVFYRLSVATSQAITAKIESRKSEIVSAIAGGIYFSALFVDFVRIWVTNRARKQEYGRQFGNTAVHYNQNDL